MLAAAQGTAVQYGVDWLIKLGERGSGRGLAVVTYTTVAGEEPPEHTHPTEDEVFYVISGRVTFLAGGAEYPVETGGIMVLPAGVPHTYRVDAASPVALLVMTYPVGDYAAGWGGFVADMEAVVPAEG
jgi:quercetin dioxygenase-like cupin family protein